MVVEVRGPANSRGAGGGGDIRLCEVCWWCHITSPPPPQDVGPPRQTGAQHLGPLLHHISKGGKKGLERKEMSREVSE